MVNSGQELAGPSIYLDTTVMCELDKFLMLSWSPLRTLSPSGQASCPKSFHWGFHRRKDKYGEERHAFIHMLPQF